MKEFINKNKSIIIAISIVCLIILLFYIGLMIYSKQRLKFYEKSTNEIVTLAKNYILNNPDMIGKDIFKYLDKNEKISEGVVYVDFLDNVALAIVYDDICYTKTFKEEGLSNEYSTGICIPLINLHADLTFYDENNPE